MGPRQKTRGKRVKGTPKGRRVDPQARAEVCALLGNDPRRRDLLIEYLHRIQDRYGCLAAAHLVSLADELKMAMAEVYEVATFYHHFDVVKEGDTRPPAITVRVCDSISCEMAGAHALLETLPRLLGPGVRVLHAPCVGRCETAPVAVVGQNPVPARGRAGMRIQVGEQGDVVDKGADQFTGVAPNLEPLGQMQEPPQARDQGRFAVGVPDRADPAAEASGQVVGEAAPAAARWGHQLDLEAGPPAQAGGHGWIGSV